MKKTLSALLVPVVLALTAASALAEARVGKPAPDFTLTDIKGKAVSLSQFKGKFVVLEWTNPDCPFVRKHYNSGNMQSLQRKYTAKGVVWLSINSSSLGKEGYVTEATARAVLAKQKGAPTDVLLDHDGKVGHLFDAKTTPDMYLISPKGELLYTGAIDSIATHDIPDIAKAKNYIAAALDESLAGKAVSVKASVPYGCSVKYAK